MTKRLTVSKIFGHQNTMRDMLAPDLIQKSQLLGANISETDAPTQKILAKNEKIQRRCQLTAFSVRKSADRAARPI